MEKSNSKLLFDQEGGKRISNGNNSSTFGTGDSLRNSKLEDKKGNPGKLAVAESEENPSLDQVDYLNHKGEEDPEKTSDRMTGRDNTIPKGDKYDDLK